MHLYCRTDHCWLVFSVIVWVLKFVAEQHASFVMVVKLRILCTLGADVL